MSEQKTPEQAIIDNMIQTTQKETNDLFDILVAKKENSRLPETIFQGYFLPYFSGREPITKDSKIMAEWISIAGTPMNEVDIIDEDDAVLFTVPSLFDTNILNVVNNAGHRTFAGIFSEYQLHNNNLPQLGDSFLGKALSGKLDQIQTDSDLQDKNLTAWKTIFHRYNITDPSDQKTTPSTGVADDDLIEYD